MDIFFQYGVTPADLEEFLGHPLSGIQPAEVTQLRAIIVSISQGEATWREVMELQRQANEEELSEGAKRVKDRMAKQADQKSKMDAQAKAAREEAAKTETKPPAGETKAPESETKTAESQPRQSEPDTTSKPEEKQEVPEGAWANRAAMLADFTPLVQELGDKAAWQIFGNNAITEEAEMSHEDENTVRAFRAMKQAVADKKAAANKPQFGKPRR